MSKRKKSQPVTTWNIDEIGAQLAHQLAVIAEALRPYRQEVGGLGLILFALLTLFNLAGFTAGALPTLLGNLMGSLFGWGAIPITTLLGLLGARLLFGLFQEDPALLSMEIIIGVELVTAAALVLVHIFSAGDNSLALARQQQGGGYIGWGLGIMFISLIGEWFTAFIFIIMGLAGLGLILRLDKTDMRRWAESTLSSEAAESPPAAPPGETIEAAESAPAAVKKIPKPRHPKPSVSADQVLSTVPRTGHFTYELPPLDLLAPAPAANHKTADARYQAQVIEDTLIGFGVPAKVVEINAGPTVTQFGIKPGTLTKKLSDGTIVEQRVRVSKINSLNNDLALALAAAPIRIETPVPGRPIVGIEVPNNAIGMVSLRASIETDYYQKAKGVLRVALGRGVGGKVVVADLVGQPHLLIAGATGSGKSVCINSIIVNLLMTHTPDNLKLLMIDPKMVELTAYNGVPHLIAPVVTDFEQVAGALAWVTREMERRYKEFANIGARNIGAYNSKVKEEDKLPYMVIIIDELADLMMLAADEIEKYICRIAQMARATGIHMIIATQRPSTDVVTGLIKANFPARIAFAVSSQIDSRVILDTPGADKLLGKGDMLYQAPDSPKLGRLQGCFVSDAEIKNVVQYWKWATKPVEEEITETDGAKGESQELQAATVPWAGILEEANKDDLLDDAIALIVENQYASTSYLQRKLGIGYPRASRLMDQLEEEGVVTPPDSSNQREVLWQPEEPEEAETSNTSDESAPPPNDPPPAA